MSSKRRKWEKKSEGSEVGECKRGKKCFLGLPALRKQTIKNKSHHRSQLVKRFCIVLLLSGKIVDREKGVFGKISDEFTSGMLMMV